MRTNNKLNPHMTPGWNRARATLVRGERSHHCAIADPFTFGGKVKEAALEPNSPISPTLPELIPVSVA